MAHDPKNIFTWDNTWKNNYIDLEEEKESKYIICPDCKGKKYIALFSSLKKCTLCLTTGKIMPGDTENSD